MQSLLSDLGPPPYIGITWRGGQKVKNLLFKSIPIDELLNALENINATFVNLQRQPSKDELFQLKQHPRFFNMADLSQFNDDLEKMLCLLFLLDDYIAVSNTNMHLRIATGKTAKVIVPHPPEWRWMLTENHSPWFTGFGIFRQTIDGSWKTALNQLTEQLVKQYE